MDCGFRQKSVDRIGLLQIEDCLDAQGGIALPPGTTLISLIDRNIANVGDSVAYRYLDYTRSVDGQAVELTWTQLGIRLRAIGAHLQQVTARADRVAILAPQGIDYGTGSSQRSRRGPLRCRCSPLNCRSMPNVSIRHFAMHSPPLF